VIRSERADELETVLRAAGIESRGYYRRPIHRQPAMYAELDLPGTAEAASTNLALPISPVLDDGQVAEVAAVVLESRPSAGAE
jgi:dTDP-3-amino-3,4,6-trideoxy-alpha-D-glucose transaminase